MRKLTLLLSFCMLFVFAFTGCSKSDIQNPNTTDGQETWDIIRDAYVFTFPLMMMEATTAKMTNTLEATSKQAPENQFIHSQSLASSENKDVVTPNVDTLYSQAFLNLKDDAVVYHKPKSDRYCSVEILDAYTNCAAILGNGGDTQDQRDYLITGPDFTGDVPDKLTHVKVNTNRAWMLIRTVVNDDADLENVYALQREMTLLPLKTWQSGADVQIAQGTYHEEFNDIPLAMVLERTPEEYFRIANRLLEENPPMTDDEEMIEHISQVGVGPGLSFDAEILGEDAENKWAEMLESMTDYLSEASAEFALTEGDWTYYGPPIAEFGTEYEYRALIALAAIGANPVSVAVYPKAETAAGVPLNGKNNYVIHFEKDALPPTKEYGFWSITAYGEDNLLIDNEIDRYLINDRSNLKFNDDGSLDIFVQRMPPSDESMQSNWLPVLDDAFHLHLRIYLPEESVISGSWKAPSITQTS